MLSLVVLNLKVSQKNNQHQYKQKNHNLYNHMKIFYLLIEFLVKIYKYRKL